MGGLPAPPYPRGPECPRPRADRGLGPGRRPAAGRAGATPRRRRDPGAAARPAVGVVAGGAGPGSGRAGPAGAPCRCRARRPARPAAAPPSTSGWSSGTASSCSSTTTRCSAPRGGRRRPRATWPRSGRGSSRASGPSAGRRRSRCRSRPWSATGRSAAGSTRCSPTRPGAATTWSTGRPAGRQVPQAERHAVSVQLAAYRLAWAALAGVPVARVRAAFYYVAHDQTVRPADLLDEAGLAALIEQVPAEA